MLDNTVFILIRGIIRKPRGSDAGFSLIRISSSCPLDGDLILRVRYFRKRRSVVKPKIKVITSISGKFPSTLVRDSRSRLNKCCRNARINSDRYNDKKKKRKISIAIGMEIRVRHIRRDSVKCHSLLHARKRMARLDLRSRAPS